MTDRFAERFIPTAMRTLDREISMWAGVCILLFAMGFVLSERIPPYYLAISVMLMGYVLSEDIHRVFPMGNMGMVLMLGRDTESLTSRYFNASLWRLIPFTVLSVLSLSVGILLRLGPEGMGYDEVVTILYFATASDLLVALRWACAVRFGRRRTVGYMAWMLLLALSPMILFTFTDWGWSVPFMVIVLLVLILLMEAVRLVWGVSKERMMEGI